MKWYCPLKLDHGKSKVTYCKSWSNSIFKKVEGNKPSKEIKWSQSYTYLIQKKALKKEKKNLGQIETNCKIIDLNLTRLGIILNINGLNRDSQIGLKTRLNYILAYKKYALHIKMQTVKDGKRYTLLTTVKKKDGVTVLILDKVDFFRANDISKNKGCH